MQRETKDLADLNYSATVLLVNEEGSNLKNITKRDRWAIATNGGSSFDG